MKTFVCRGASLSLLILILSGVVLAQSSQSEQSTEMIKAHGLNDAVVKLYAEGKYDEALPLAEQVLHLGEHALGPDHQDLIPFLVNLGEVHRAKKNLKEAELAFSRALKIGEKAYGNEDTRLDAVLDKFALVAFERGDDSKAESLWSRLLELKKKALGADSPDLALTEFRLGQVYSFRRDYQRAARHYKRAVDLREKVAKENDPDLLTLLRAYMGALAQLDRTDEMTRVQQRIAELSGKQSIAQGGILNGKALVLVAPEYPIEAKRDHALGEVQVQVTIDVNGKVVSARAINANRIHRALVAAAERVAFKARFSPTFVLGTPVEVIGIIIYRFVSQ